MSTSAYSKLAFFLLLLAIATLSLLPAEHLPKQAFNLWDKAQHALAFAGLGLLGLLAFRRAQTRLLFSLLVFGASIEVAQTATGWRYGEWGDLLADGVGIALAWLIVFVTQPQWASD